MKKERLHTRGPQGLLPILLGACLGLLLWGCSEGHAARPRNVILVCIDTVRADHLGCYGYDEHATTPALDSLAERSTLFLEASSTAGWTKPSVPSFLTGTLPLQHGVYDGSSSGEGGVHSDVLPQRAVTIAERFNQAGYETGAFVRNAHLREGLGFEQGFETYVDRAGDAREIRWQATDWLEEREGERPFFLYLHFLDAHWPYPVPEEYATLFADAEDVAMFRTDDWKGLRDAINHGSRTLDERDREALLALYDGSIRYVDDQLGRLFARLEELGMAEDTVVCVLSDHGEEFLEHGRIGHGHGLYETLLHVPWILHVPDREARRIETPVSLLDLYPTLLSAAGLAVPGGVDGLDRMTQPHRPAPVLAEHVEPGSYHQSCRHDETKLLRIFEPRDEERGARDGAEVLVVGTRWEVLVEVDPGGSGALRAERLRLRPDDEADPLEVKGTVADLTGDSFRMCGGLEVRVGPSCELYGDGGGILAEGRYVKVRGERDAAGLIAARKIKLYGPDETPEHALRGRLGAVALEDGVGPIEIGGVRVVVDAETRIDASRSKRPRMDRDRVLALLEAEEGGAEDLGLSTRVQLFDLARDPDEERPGGTALELRRLGAGLDELLRARLESRVWGAEDRASLSEEDLRALRAIGYVK